MPALLIRMSSRPRLGRAASYRIGRLGLLGDVRLQDQRGPALLADLAGERLEALRPASHERDGGAATRKVQGGRLADAARRPGDQGDGAVQDPRRPGIIRAHRPQLWRECRFRGAGRGGGATRGDHPQRNPVASAATGSGLEGSPAAGSSRL